MQRAEQKLAAAGIENPQDEAEQLAAHVLGIGRTLIALRGAQPLDEAARRSLDALVERRAHREPLQQIVGCWPFLDLELAVDRRALIPRPETEDLTEHALALLGRRRAARVADVGTGSGCIALAVAASRPDARVVAIDVDARALELAQANVSRLGLTARVTLVHGDLLGAIRPTRSLDLVVANLPYVGESEIDDLAPEVRDYEPRQALVAGDGGQALIRRLIGSARSVLSQDGWLVLETAPQQAGRVASWLQRDGWSGTSVARDRYGRSRIVSARRGADRSPAPR